jgi:hypothetical protein
MISSHFFATLKRLTLMPKANRPLPNHSLCCWIIKIQSAGGAWMLKEAGKTAVDNLMVLEITEKERTFKIGRKHLL